MLPLSPLVFGEITKQNKNMRLHKGARKKNFMYVNSQNEIADGDVWAKRG